MTEHHIFRLGIPAILNLQLRQALQFLLHALKTGPAADNVQSFMPRRGDQPGARVCWNALQRPLLECSGKGFLRRLLGQIKIAEEANQSGEDPSRLLAVDFLEILSLEIHRAPHTRVA